MSKLDDAYKRLNILEYTRIVKGTLIPFFDEYDGAFLTTLTPDTVFTIKPHYFNDLLLGYNIYADKVLLETKSTEAKAKKYLKSLV